MNTPHVTLLAEGIFEIPSSEVGKRDYRVNYDVMHEDRPWKVVSDMGDTGAWREEDSFQSLDEALDWAIALSTDTFPTPGYGVTLPCGTFFSRPGRIQIEDVMASIGWTYVISVDGWSPLTRPKGTPLAFVLPHFTALVEETGAVLGSVDLCPPHDGEEDNGTQMWIADITIPIGNFVHKDHAHAVFAEAFELEGIPHTDCFDFTGRINVTPRTADIFDFATAHAAREAERKAQSETDAINADKAKETTA